MSLRKYQKVESTQVASPKEHAQIESNLHRLGKTSAVDLTEEERKSSLDTKRSN